MTVHVRHKSLYIYLPPSSAQQQREMTIAKFCIV